MLSFADLGTFYLFPSSPFLGLFYLSLKIFLDLDFSIFFLALFTIE
jgi:hypothetical protein